MRVREVNGCATSASSTAATINVPITTTTNGSTWSNGSPDSTKKVVFKAGGTIPNITTLFEACSCQIDSGANVVVGSPGAANGSAIMKIENGLNVQGTLTFENNASLIQTNNSPTINSGSIIYKRISQPMNTSDYTYWSSPVSGQTLGALSPNTLSDNFFRWGTIAAGRGPGLCD